MKVDKNTEIVDDNDDIYPEHIPPVQREIEKENKGDWLMKQEKNLVNTHQ